MIPKRCTCSAQSTPLSKASQGNEARSSTYLLLFLGHFLKQVLENSRDQPCLCCCASITCAGANTEGYRTKLVRRSAGNAYPPS